MHCRIAAVELFITAESAWFPSAVLWVSKWRQEGSPKDSKPQGRPFSARAPYSVEPVRDAMLRSPRRSAQRQGLALRLN